MSNLMTGKLVYLQYDTATIQMLVQQMQFPLQLFQLLRYAQENILHKLKELGFVCVWHGHAQYTKFKDWHLTNLSLVSNYIDRDHLI